MNVSRVNKEFRQLLVDDEYSDSIWKAAREEAGMPDLVSTDITQRQYILLIFDKNCHVSTWRTLKELAPQSYFRIAESPMSKRSTF
jgi:hypothetical protein